ncbi:MAG: ABC transporter permease [Gemmatimonadaceae bacterium]|nr:ABC transporter permease [Gemmatimonadaceae bacterium]
MSDVPLGVIDATIRAATPIGLAAIGELLAERAGILNIGIEGGMCLAAFAAVVAGAGSPVAGLMAGVLAGILTASVFALFVIRLRAQQVIVGTAVSMMALGLSTVLNRVLYAGLSAAPQVHTLPPMRVPVLSALPGVGQLLAQPLPTYVLYAAGASVAWFLYRTIGGLSLRATGEDPSAVRAAGKDPALFQWAALVVSGALTGLAGATLVVAQAGTFTENMSAGRGYIAIAVVALGRWTPAGVLVGSLLFGAASSLQYIVQAYGVAIPYNLTLAAPYAVTLFVLAALRGSHRAPARLGRTIDLPG